MVIRSAIDKFPTIMRLIFHEGFFFLIMIDVFAGIFDCAGIMYEIRVDLFVM